MNAQDVQPSETGDEFSFPLNLAAWASECQLLEWVEEAVEQFDWTIPELVEHLRRNPDYRPKQMLCLLAYAYATQIFSSDEIVNRCYSDTVFRLLCQNKAPTLSEVRRFRRENRGLLKGMLVPVLVRALKSKFELDDILIPSGLKKFLLQDAIKRLDLARHMDNLDG